MDILFRILSVFLTCLGMISRNSLVRFFSLNYWDKVKLASKLQRKIHQDITKIYSLSSAGKVSLFKFTNGEHYLSDEPVLKVIREYNYVVNNISHSLFTLGTITPFQKLEKLMYQMEEPK